MVSAVMLPLPDSPIAMQVYFEFLRNDHEEIRLMIGQFDRQAKQWNVNPDRRAVTWLKNYDAWPLRV
jgi:hypothetical protein